MGIKDWLELFTYCCLARDLNEELRVCWRCWWVRFEVEFDDRDRNK